MTYQIEFTKAAKRDFEGLTKEMRRRVDAIFSLLRENPRPPKAEKLKGKLSDYYRVRIGDFRLIYLIEEDRLVVCVLKIGHRKDVYK